MSVQEVFFFGLIATSFEIVTSLIKGSDLAFIALNLPCKELFGDGDGDVSEEEQFYPFTVAAGMSSPIL